MVPLDGSPIAAAASRRPGRLARLLQRRLRFSLQFSLVAVLLGTVVITGAAVHVPWSYISRENVSDMAMQMNADIVGDISKEVDALFRSAEDEQQTLADLLASGVVDVIDADQIDQLLFSFLKSNKNFSWVSYGRPNGDFLGAQRRDDVNYRIVKSVWDADAGHAARSETYVTFDGEQYNSTRTKIKLSDYYSPSRDWYTLAAARPGHIWTDVYVFATSGMPGINTAFAYRNGDSLIGVVSIAIELERISRYLKELEATRRGTAFIVDRSGEMVAFKDPGEVVEAAQNGGEPRRKRLNESWQPLLRIAQSAIAADRVAFYELAAPRHMVYENDGTDGRYFVTLAPIGRQNWIVGTVVREQDFLGRVDENRKLLVLTVLAAMLAVGCAAIVLARHLFIAPLDHIIRQTHEVERFNLDAVHTVPTYISEIHELSAAVHQMSLGLVSFRKYLPTELVRSLLSEGIRAMPGGEQRTLTILFMDLAGFTAATERLGPRIVPMLGDYLAAMSEAIVGERGTIDKFIGDAVMAFWGAPIYNENHAAEACRAALRCLQLMRGLEARWHEQKRPVLRARIGINSGRVVVGNIGSSERLNYTVVGDPVNLASRLEGMNKAFGTELIISQTTYELAKYDIVARRLDTVTVKGRDEPVKIYELLAMADENGEAPGFEWVAVFERALDLYEAKNWAEAQDGFERVVALRGEDPPSRIFLERLADRQGIEAQLRLAPPGAAD
jgi:adenylate cyclase